MEQAWTEAFYWETDAVKRLELLKQNAENDPADVAQFRKKLWVARYGKRKPNKDTFIGCLMQLKSMAEGTTIDLGGKRKKEAAQIINRLCLTDVELSVEDKEAGDGQTENRQEVYREILLAELKNVFLKFIEVSKGGRGFTSLVFGMGQLSDEGVIKKIAEQISVIAFQAPHILHMEKEFELLKEAALQAFRQEYPNREHFLKK